MLLLKSSPTLLFITASVLAFFSLAAPAPSGMTSDDWYARNPPRAASAPDIQAGALEDTASSRSRSHLNYPGTDVPQDVVSYLLEERHGVDQHDRMLTQPGRQDVTLSNLDEVLKDPRTKVSPFAYHGTTYFLAPAKHFSGSAYPDWTAILSKPGEIHNEAVLPVFIGRLQANSFRDGGWINERPYELMAIRTPAEKAGRVQLLQSLKEGRHMITYTELLNQVARELREGRVP